MIRLPSNLPKLLRDAGLKVVELDGWHTRGRPGSFGPVGVLNHHTGAYDRIGDLADDLRYAKWMALEGRSDLPAPLVQLALSLEGTVYVLAAGRANHAGVAKSSGSVAQGDGNSLYVGIEWMLSGTQPIPAHMYEAGVKLNAVLLDLLGSSVQAISCHYQTSVTGKWDIGDPNGIPFNGHRVFNVPKFRGEVKKHRDAKTQPKAFHKVLTFQHTPMQFSDSPKQQAQDAERIFARAARKGITFCTGTEAADKPLNTLLPKAATKHGYRLRRVDSLWVASREEDIKGSFESGHIPVLTPKDGVGRHGPRGVVWLSHDIDRVGSVAVAVGHYLTNGSNPSKPNFEINRSYAKAIGDWAREQGKGRRLAFYAGDQNINDRYEDTFFGSPLTSCWDELERYENTGHGCIDVVASYDRDDRVTCQSATALNDSEFRLATDHFLVEAAYRVRV